MASNKNKNFDKILHQISYKPKDRINIFRQLSPLQQRSIILSLSKHLQYEIVSRLNKSELVNLLEQLDPDEATDIVQLLPEKKRKIAIKEVNAQLSADISLLLQFDPETAAGLMNVDYIAVEANDTIASVAKQVKVHERRTGKLPAILIMDYGKLIGYLPGHELGFSTAREKAVRHLKKIKTVRYNADTKEVIDIFRRHPHNKIAVLGKKGNVMGIIYSDDILKVLREREASTLYDFAGVHEEESVYDPIKRKVKFRYKWLIINLGTAFLAAFTVGLFDATIAKYVLLAVYMPIVAGMGGNAATQTLAVMVRGITLKQINFHNVFRTLKNELGSGFVNGLINGLLITIIIYFKDGDLRIGLILAIAMVINLLIAALFGTIVPLVMSKLGKDPASSATIFITTATDVFGFFVFLGIATLILR